MTHRVVHEARRLAGPGVQVRGVTASFGSEVIASRESFAVGAQAGLEAWRGVQGWPDAIVLACFGDPGLAALGQAAGVPVAGMAQAALRQAVALARPYRIVTAGAQWPAMLRETVQAEGAGDWLEDIVALDTTGLAVSRDPDGFLALVQAALDDAGRAGVPTVILGGAGFAGMRARLNFGGTLIDGLEAAVASLLP